MYKEYEDEGVQPETLIPEETDFRLEFRYKALVLFLILLIPTLVIVYELVSGQMDVMWANTVQPHLPQMDQIVTF